MGKDKPAKPQSSRSRRTRRTTQLTIEVVECGPLTPQEVEELEQELAELLVNAHFEMLKRDREASGPENTSSTDGDRAGNSTK